MTLFLLSSCSKKAEVQLGNLHRCPTLWFLSITIIFKWYSVNFLREVWIRPYGKHQKVKVHQELSSKTAVKMLKMPKADLDFTGEIFESVKTKELFTSALRTCVS